MTNVEDFRRLGLRTGEFRLAVIRRAVSQQGAGCLQQCGIDGANHEIELQIVRLAVSGYRVMDPRRRPDGQERAMLGRIQPGALRSASPVAFCSHPEIDDSDELETPSRVEAVDQGNASKDALGRRLSGMLPGPNVANRIAERFRSCWPIASLTPSKLAQSSGSSNE
ncbi:MAG: hypothetical protein AAF664_19185 [Planctomycetota bacterium]